MNTEHWIALGAIVPALITLVVSSVSAARARVKTIEDAYIARYWQILDHFPADALIGEGGPQGDAEETPAERAEREKLRKSVLLYLRLCEDELELRKLGWVGGKTWDEWSLGIRAQLKQWPVAEEWAPIRDGQLAPHQFALLRNLDNNTQPDPFQPRSLSEQFVGRWRGCTTKKPTRHVGQ
ncbi:hypothetical protein [Streptomyces microflavus]|uniref:hypothetical protein n=1 Tax=Streptomyces microflavus TaxID=1919 RepID=UPI002E0D5B8A|nr:hypothetical protein OG728_00005 [Streptomyces microflavus]WSR95853.1 hypothetical protein OG728_38035 [Streptomyces microflavus]